MELLGLTFRWKSTLKPKKTSSDISSSDRKNKLNFVHLLEHFYHIREEGGLVRTLFEDLTTSIFMGAGSGLFISFLRGIYFQVFINYRFPAIIGKSFKIINRSKIKIGKIFWAKDNVTLFAGGPLVIGNGAVLAERSTIWSGKEGVFIGDNIFLGMGSYISALRGKVKIGDDVMIADHVRFYTWNHKFIKGKTLFSHQGGEFKTITIGNNCWLGTGCIVLAGVKLGNNCVVAAGSVLTKSFADNSMIAGIPAKVIRKI